MEQGKPPPMIGGKKGMGNGRDSEVITISSAFHSRSRACLKEVTSQRRSGFTTSDALMMLN